MVQAGLDGHLFDAIRPGASDEGLGAGEAPEMREGRRARRKKRGAGMGRRRCRVRRTMAGPRCERPERTDSLPCLARSHRSRTSRHRGWQRPRRTGPRRTCGPWSRDAHSRSGSANSSGAGRAGPPRHRGSPIPRRASRPRRSFSLTLRSRPVVYPLSTPAPLRFLLRLLLAVSRLRPVSCDQFGPTMRPSRPVRALRRPHTPKRVGSVRAPCVVCRLSGWHGGGVR